MVSQANRGPAAARNMGLRTAQGNYVCFLDADDEYAPGFLAEAVGIMEGESRAVAVGCGVELVRLHRAVEPWQLDLIEATLPGNVVVRADAARLVGGFPEDPAFRGRSAGEDAAFRTQLFRLGPC